VPKHLPPGQNSVGASRTASESVPPSAPAPNPNLIKFPSPAIVLAVHGTAVPGISTEQYQRVVQLFRTGASTQSIAPTMKIPYLLAERVVHTYVEELEKRVEQLEKRQQFAEKPGCEITRLPRVA